MRLVEIYRRHLIGLSDKAKLMTRRRWHATAKLYLNLRSITSDPPPKFPPMSVDHVRPFAPFWLARSIDELEELYRETYPPPKGKQKKPE